MKAKATVNLRSGPSGLFALYAACQEGHLKSARLLLEAKAEVDLAAADGATAFTPAMTVEEMNRAFEERDGELKSSKKRVALMTMGLADLLM